MTDMLTEAEFLYDEVTRLTMENGHMFALANSRKPLYGTVAAPDSEVTPFSVDEFDVNGAIAELADARGLDPAEVAEQVFMLSGGEHDTEARALAVVELASMDEDEALSLTVSASERKKFAKSGVAMPGGHFPIHDLDHLAAAKAFYHQGKHAGQDPEEIRAHINRRARALGGEGLDDEDGDEDGHESEHQGNEGPKPRPGRRHTRPVQVRRRGQSPFGSEGGGPEGGEGPSGVAATGRRMLVRAGRGYETIALSEDEEWAEAEIARLTAEHPTVGLARTFDTPNDLGDMQKHFDFEVYDVGARDDGDPSDTDAAKEIARVLKEHGGTGLFDGGGAAYGNSTRGKRAGKYPGTGPSGKPQTAGR